MIVKNHGKGGTISSNNLSLLDSVINHSKDVSLPKRLAQCFTSTAPCSKAPQTHQHLQHRPADRHDSLRVGETETLTRQPQNQKRRKQDRGIFYTNRSSNIEDNAQPAKSERHRKSNGHHDIFWPRKSRMQYAEGRFKTRTPSPCIVEEEMLLRECRRLLLIVLVQPKVRPPTLTPRCG